MPKKHVRNINKLILITKTDDIQNLELRKKVESVRGNRGDVVISKRSVSHNQETAKIKAKHLLTITSVLVHSETLLKAHWKCLCSPR